MCSAYASADLAGHVIPPFFVLCLILTAPCCLGCRAFHPPSPHIQSPEMTCGTTPCPAAQASRAIQGFAVGIQRCSLSAGNCQRRRPDAHSMLARSAGQAQELSKRRESLSDLAPILWHSPGAYRATDAATRDDFRCGNIATHLSSCGSCLGSDSRHRVQAKIPPQRRNNRQSLFASSVRKCGNRSSFRFCWDCVFKKRENSKTACRV